MRAAGYEPEDFEHDIVEVWPENWSAFKLFSKLRTQWTVRPMGGISGLRYEAIYPLLDRMGLSTSDWDQLFDDVRVMEQAALDAQK